MVIDKMVAYFIDRHSATWYYNIIIINYEDSRGFFKYW